MHSELQILIVDDQYHARRSLQALIATRFQLVKTCEATNGIEAIQCLEECKPDLILMDVRMPEMDGIEATRIIKTKSEHTPVIVLSMYPEYRESAIAAGADSFFSKGESPEQLLLALTAVIAAANTKKEPTLKHYEERKHSQ
jgi:CheY-like chemotaxis protein